MNILNCILFRVIATGCLMSYGLLCQTITAQSCNTGIIDATCFPDGSGEIYNNVVISEVSGDPGQSDGCNDGIVEISGPPGTNIGCMVVSNSEWAVLIPPNTTIPADGVYLIACSQDPNGDCGTGGAFSEGNGQACDDCDFPGLDGLSGTGAPPADGSVTNNEIDLDVCDPDATTFYDPAATGFTIDNSNSADGDQVMLFLPDGTPHDGIYWGLPNTTSGGDATVGGASGNADAVVIQIVGQTYTLGDNDQDGVVNNNPTSYFFTSGPDAGLSGRGDRSALTGATMVPVLPTDAGCPCNTPANPGTFTMPSLSDVDFWFDMNLIADGGEGISATYKGCNSSFSRLDAGTSDGGSHGNPSHADGETTIGMTGVVEMFDPTAFTPSACDANHADANNLEAQWAYTDHPTPGVPNDDSAYMFSTTTELLCDPNTPVTFTVEVYNYQHVSDDSDTGSGTDNLQTGSLVNDPILGDGQTWMTYDVSGETTTMTYTVNSFPGPGSYTFDLVWDDFSNCCGTQGNPGNQANPNECYETKSYTIVVQESIVGATINPCDGSGALSVSTTAGSDIVYTLIKNGVATVSNTSGSFSGIIDDADPDPVYEIQVANECSSVTLPVDAACYGLPPCPTIDYNCVYPTGDICPGDVINMQLTVQNVPAGSNINFYSDNSATFDPYANEGMLIQQIATPVAPANTVVINEILFNPVGNDGSGDNDEWVELFGPAGMDVGCWKISDGDYTIVFPAGTTIPASGFFTIGNTGNGGPEGICGDQVPNIDILTCGCIFNASFINNNGQEAVYLFDDNDVAIDGMAWGAPGDSDHNNGSVENYGAVGSCTAGTITLPPASDPIIDYINPINEENGQSIGRNPDGGATIERFTDETACPNNDNGILLTTSFGGPNVLTATFAFDETFCNLGGNGEIYVLGIIEGLDLANCPQSCANGSDTCDDACTPLMLTMNCPTADLVPAIIDVCEADQSSVDITVNLANLSAGDTYSVMYALDGVAQTPISAAGTETSATITINGPTSGEVKVTLISVQNIVAGGCIGNVDTDEACVAIRPTPTGEVTASTDITACDGSGDGSVTFTFTGIGPFDFEYTVDGGSPIVVSSVNSPYTLNTTTAGTYMLTAVSDENGCIGTFSGMQTVNNNTPDLTEIAVTTQPATVCNDGSVSIDLTDDAVVDLTPGYNTSDFLFFAIDPNTLTEAQQNNAAFQITSVDNVTADATVYVLYTDPTTGCTSSASIMIDVDASACSAATCPVIGALSDPDDICQGETFDITASGLDDMAAAQNGDMDFGIAFQIFTGGTAPTDPYMNGTNLGTVTFANLTGTDPNQMANLMDVGSTLTDGTYQICAILTPNPTDTNCRPSQCITFVVNPPDDAGFMYPNTACINGMNPTPTMIITPGGTFTVNNGATINGATGELDLSTTTAGTTYTVTYTTVGNCPASSTQMITINAGGNASFTYPSSVCQNAANPVATITGDAGGTFSVDNGATINATTGELDLSTTTVATTYTITYSFGGACPASSTQMITIQRPDNADFTYPNMVCQNAATNPTATITGATGDTFTVNNGATIDAATGELDLSTTTGGTTYTITYSVNGPCPNSETQMITVQAADDANFDYPTAACMNAATNPTASNITTAGGTFMVNNGATINGATGELDLSTTTGGTTYTITYTTAGTCPNTATQIIAIQVVDDANFDYATTVCINATNPTASNTATAGGTFTVNNGATIDDVTGELDLSTTTAGTTYTISYTTNGNCPNTATQMTTVQAADDASFTFPTTACQNATTNPAASNIATAGGTFSVNNGATINSTTGELDLSATTGGTTYTISYTTAGDCPNTATQVIAIQTADDASFDYPMAACMNAATNPTASNIATPGGIFSVDNGATIDAATGELDLSTTTQNTTYTITYNTNGDCPNSSTQIITIGMTDDANFDYPATACINATTNPTASNIATPGGTFTVNNGATIDVTTGELELSSTTAGTTYTITYSTTGTCANSATQDILINPAPNASIALAGEMDICNGTSTTIDFFAGGGTADFIISYEINDGIIATTETVTVGSAGMTTVTVSPIQNTTYTLISVENSEGCTATATGSVTVNVLPNPTANPATLTECADGNNAIAFDLNAAIDVVNGGTTSVSVSFHLTSMEAQMNQNPLSSPFNAQPNTVIFARVTDDATGCFSTSEVTLLGYDCEASIDDPCSCLDNAITADDGQFSDNVIVTAPAGQVWYISTVTGLFDPMIDYPNPIPSGTQYALVPFQTGASGELLVEEPSGVAGISNYYLQGIHVDGLGYSITVTNGATSLSVPNGAISDTRCFYPDLFLTLDNNVACLDGNPINISFGENNGAAGTGNLFLNNIPYNSSTIDPTTLNAGIYTLRYDFDAGIATQGEETDPGCLQSIETTFEISTPNEILCRPPINTVADTETCGAVVQPLPPVIVTENVPVANVTSDAPTTFPIGTTQVTWTVTDANGCAETCTQSVTVNDLTPPIITCGNAFYAGTSWNNCGYPSFLLPEPTVSDNCGILSITNDAPSFFEPGMYMPTWTVTDVNGNTASCMQWVSISDTTKPKFTSCPSEMTVTAQTNDGAIVTWPLPTAMDNCFDELVFVSTHDSGDFFPVGTTMVTYTVYDQGGNSEECSFFVNVEPSSGLVDNPTTPNHQLTKFHLFQNKPNPFADYTKITFNLPKDDFATLTIYDLSGRILKKCEGQFLKGINEIEVKGIEIEGSGLLFYELKTATDAAIGRMILE